MKIIRLGLVVMWVVACSVSSAVAQVNVGIGIGLPNLSIGINLPVYPELVPVPGYPVYYAPQVDGNYFFYDGMYWVYQNDNWYASSWYNGPWGFVEPSVVPLFILRIPVGYYRQPPPYFNGWRSNAPPRWGQHWGRGWERQRGGWNSWKRGSAPSRAPLPAYQRQYAGDRYPRADQQHSLRGQSYRYQPRDRVVRQHIRQQNKQDAPANAPRGRQVEPQVNSRGQLGAPADRHSQPPQHGGEFAQRPGPDRAAQQQHSPAPRAQGQEQKQQERGEPQGSDRGRGQGQNKDEERGRGRN